ncbi:unnamed protein product [Calicophoron daubneyi]|uniref:Outer dynein arm-docking complex subunit 4 n=1 Tax=Calicophoron daubneyi TaxID=300641 RepID=A0AAV2T4E6_CALDB
MSRESSEERQNASKCPFEVYRSEGDSLFLRKKYEKATECYNQALEKKPGDPYCLIKRSACYVSMSKYDEALSDADAALKAEPGNHRALYQKAEVLYNRGEFEFALIFFHRGRKKRPELQEFRLGIQKCEEAIRNSLDNKNALRMNSAGSKAFLKHLEDKNQKRPATKITKGKEKQTKVDDVPLHILPRNKCRAIFTHLFTDHEYLKRLDTQEMASKKWRTACSDEVRKITREGLDYLDARSRFWHQEKPVYAYKIHKMNKNAMKLEKKKKQGLAIIKVLEKLHEIDEHQHMEEHVIAVKLAESLRHDVGLWSEDEFPNRLEVLANVNSMLGLSHLELGNYDKALSAHERAFRLGIQCNLPEIVSHAVDNLGRVHAKKGNYQEAINIWQQKLENCGDDYELTWLHYEIGRCFLELEDPNAALEHGDEALRLAKQIGDEAWQLNIHVLIGQANLHLKKRAEAHTSFLIAHSLAKMLKAGDAEKAILEVMDEFQSTECELDSESITISDLKSEESPLKAQSVS